MLDPKRHQPFRFAGLDDLREAVRQLGLELSVEGNVSSLTRPATVAGKRVPNAMATLPMEGCDGKVDGGPDVLTFRRYQRFGAGGAGLIWFEACCVTEDGRSSPRKLWLYSANKDEFRKLVDATRKAAADSMGPEHKPLLALQLTHSGRYSLPKPAIAFHDPLLDAHIGLPDDYPVVTDDYLERLEDRYVEVAQMAFEVGFDAVDVKACHRYLVSELLAAHMREGRYGGSYENRTRFLRNVVGKIRAALGPGGAIACRLNVCDAHPNGWGVDKNDPNKPDLTEPLRLVGELRELGVSLIGATAGNPRFNPHVNRPHDGALIGGHLADEHPLVGVARLIGLVREVQRAAKEVAVVGVGFSWLRHLWPNVAAAEIRGGGMTMAGLGRQSFAYPGFAKEIIQTGRLDPKHVCVTCSRCSQIMRDGGRTGCVPFDKEIYGPIYREVRPQSKPVPTQIK